MTFHRRSGETRQALITGALTRRDVLRHGAAVGLAAPAIAGALTTPGTRRARAQDGASVTIGQGIGINTLDPHQTATVGTDLSVISHLYTSLVLRGPDMALQERLL